MTSLDALKAAGIQFEEKSGGVTGTVLAIGKPVVLHFWPQSERWKVLRTTHNGKGVGGLIKWLRSNHPELLGK